jgi:hypothetical protein
MSALRKENARLRYLLNRARSPHEDAVHRDDIPLQEDDPVQVSEAIPTDRREEAPGQLRILAEIVNNSQLNGSRIHGRRWDEATMKIMFVLYATSPNAYSLLKMMIAVPAISSLYRDFGPELNEVELWLQDPWSIQFILSKWRRKIGLTDDVIIDVILGVDAASFAPVE